MNGHNGLDLGPSDLADSIFYADLFHINGRNWMIMGAGKSTAARIASKCNLDADLSRDCVALERQGQALRGRYDPGALAGSPERFQKLHSWHPIHVVAYCFSEEETTKAYANRPWELLEADSGLVAYLAARYPYPAYLAGHFFSEHALEHLANPVRRCERLLELTQGTAGINYVLVPFCQTVEDKAAMYCNFSPTNNAV